MKKLISLSGLATAILCGVLYFLAGITDIDPGEVGLIVKKIGANKGMQERTLDTGMHWIEPLVNDISKYDTKFRQFDVTEIPANTKDGQPIRLDISLEIGLIDEKVPNLHEKIGRDYFDQVVYPAVRQVVRNSTSTQLSDEIYTGDGRTYIQRLMRNTLTEKLLPYGINIDVNLRDISFQNQDFVATLEEKAKAAQEVTIQERKAEAAAQEAIRVANVAEGQKQRAIKEAEAERERLRLQGEGERLQKEEVAKGILAIGQAEAEAMRLKSLALGAQGGEHLVGLAWAEAIGPNVQFWGVPTGTPGTTNLMDLNGMIQGAFGPKGGK